MNDPTEVDVAGPETIKDGIDFGQGILSGGIDTGGLGAVNSAVTGTGAPLGPGGLDSDLISEAVKQLVGDFAKSPTGTPMQDRGYPPDVAVYPEVPESHGHGSTGGGQPDTWHVKIYQGGGQWLVMWGTVEHSRTGKNETPGVGTYILPTPKDPSPEPTSDPIPASGAWAGIGFGNIMHDPAFAGMTFGGLDIGSPATDPSGMAGPEIGGGPDVAATGRVRVDPGFVDPNPEGDGKWHLGAIGAVPSAPSASGGRPGGDPAGPG